MAFRRASSGSAAAFAQPLSVNQAPPVQWAFRRINARKYKRLAALRIAMHRRQTPKQDRVGRIIKGFQRVAVGQPLRQES